MHSWVFSIHCAHIYVEKINCRAQFYRGIYVASLACDARVCSLHLNFIIRVRGERKEKEWKGGREPLLNFPFLTHPSPSNPHTSLTPRLAWCMFLTWTSFLNLLLAIIVMETACGDTRRAPVFLSHITKWLALLENTRYVL